MDVAKEDSEAVTVPPPPFFMMLGVDVGVDEPVPPPPIPPPPPLKGVPEEVLEGVEIPSMEKEGMGELVGLAVPVSVKGGVPVAVPSIVPLGVSVR